MKVGGICRPAGLALAAALVGTAAFAGAEYPELPLRIADETAAQKEARMAWWTHDRFGLFVHFGVYAIPARGEWVKSVEYIPEKEYDEKYVANFNPDLFDAKAWARAARAAGMKYAVLTAKHHDGYCLWDTKTTDYRITKSAFGRDVVREFLEAFRAEGLRVGLYFSIKDWHHPDYIVDGTHPRRPREDHEWSVGEFEKINAGKDWNRYREYMYAQVRELLTDYGRIDIVWYDYTLKLKGKLKPYGKTYKDWDSVRLVRLTRELQPGALIDNRLDLMDTDDGWDFVTPEQMKAASWPTVRGRRVPWETCYSLSEAWGYQRHPAAWKSPHHLITLLAETVSKGGNLIVNVGPTARGEFDGRALASLEAYGKWLRHNGRAIYGCTEAPAELAAPDGTVLTYSPETRKVYIHLLDYPMAFLPVAWHDRIALAQFLDDGSELKTKVARGNYQSGEIGERGGIVLPMERPDTPVPVIEVTLKAGEK